MSNYFKQTGPCFNSIGPCNPTAKRMRGGKEIVTQALGASAQEYDLTLPVLASGIKKAKMRRAMMRRRGMGDDEIDFEVICTQNPSDPSCSSVDVSKPSSSTAADPQTAYQTCLKGGGSFASCNQIPGVTPEMIAAAKAGNLSTPSMPSLAKTALFVGAAGLALYLLTR